MLCDHVHNPDVDEFYWKNVLFVLFLSRHFNQDDLLFVLIRVVDEFVLIEFERNFLYLGCFIEESLDVSKFLEDALNLERRRLGCVILSGLYTFVDIIN